MKVKDVAAKFLTINGKRENFSLGLIGLRVSYG